MTDQPPEHRLPPTTDAQWDERYRDSDQVWSGRPNGALVAEVRGLPPGTALDVGCGEGADAVWLAGQGWSVTGLDVSQVALERAADAARAAGVDVRWVRSGLVDAGLRAGFDLVVAMYPALPKAAGGRAEQALLDAVAPGGTLLVVHHAGMQEHARASGWDPDAYVQPCDVATRLDDGWTVEVDERRERDAPTEGAGAHHAEDVVLRARRR